MQSKKIVFICLFISSLCHNALANSPKNIILMIGDGMGPNYLTAYRDFKDNPKTAYVEPTLFDSIHKGIVSTKTYDFSKDKKQFQTIVTDSAASATAYSCGSKAINETIGMQPNEKPCETMFEVAKKFGKKTGIAVTSSVVHATPAAFISHIDSREKYNELARKYVEEKINSRVKFDVLLGGGTSYFSNENKDLINHLEKEGFQFIYNRKDLLESPADKIIGLFGEDSLPGSLDTGKEFPELAEMTKVALDKLENSEKGFLLLVEGSQIDWAGHANDITQAMYEMQGFEKSLEIALKFAKKHTDTLVIVTADHETGGMSLGRDGIYKTDLQPIKNLQFTPDMIIFNPLYQKQLKINLKKYLPFNKFNNELQNEIASLCEKFDKVNKPKLKTEVLREIYKKTLKAIDLLTYTGWTTLKHTGTDVNIMAFGPGAEEFLGYQDNTDVGKKIRNFLMKN